MKEYVESFLKMEIQNDKHYSEEECDRINKSYQQLGLNIHIGSEDTTKNPVRNLFEFFVVEMRLRSPARDL